MPASIVCTALSLLDVVCSHTLRREIQDSGRLNSIVLSKQNYSPPPYISGGWYILRTTISQSEETKYALHTREERNTFRYTE